MVLLLLAAFYLLESVQSIKRYALLNTRLHFVRFCFPFSSEQLYLSVFLSQRVNVSKFFFDFLPSTQLRMNSNSDFLASFWNLKIETLKSFLHWTRLELKSPPPPPPPPDDRGNIMTYGHCISCKYQQLSKGGIRKPDTSSRGETKFSGNCAGG